MRRSHASSGPDDHEDPSSLSAAVLIRNSARPKATQRWLQLDNSLPRFQFLRASSSRYSYAKAFCLGRLSPEASRSKGRDYCPNQSRVLAAHDSEHPTAAAAVTCPAEDLPNRRERSCALIGKHRPLPRRVHAPILLMTASPRCHILDRSWPTLYRRSWSRAECSVHTARAKSLAHSAPAPAGLLVGQLLQPPAARASTAQ